MKPLRVRSWTEFGDMLYVRVEFPTKSVHKVFFDYMVPDTFHSLRDSLYVGAGITAVSPTYLDTIATEIPGQPLSWVYLVAADGITVLDVSAVAEGVSA